MHVPLVNIQAQLQPLRAEIDAAIARVLDQGAFILGDEVARFEDEIGSWLGSHAVGVASGTDALWLSLKLAGVGTGDLVLTSPFTFFATASSIRMAGAVPVFADINPCTFTLDLEDARRVLDGSHRVVKRLGFSPADIKAVVPVHLYGQAVDLDGYRALANHYGIELVEDAAQAMGATWRGERVGKQGLCAWSFFPTKNLGALGDGGLVSCEDPAKAARVKRLRAHGMEPRYFHQEIGTNSRLDAIQAAILRVRLKYLSEAVAQRQQNADFYNSVFANTSRVVTPQVLPEAGHAYHQYTLRILNGNRDAVSAQLKEAGVGCAIYYQVPCHLQQALADAGWQSGDFPVAERAAREVLSLPIGAEVTQPQLEYVGAAVCSALSEA